MSGPAGSAGQIDRPTIGPAIGPAAGPSVAPDARAGLDAAPGAAAATPKDQSGASPGGRLRIAAARAFLRPAGGAATGAHAKAPDQAGGRDGNRAPDWQTTADPDAGPHSGQGASRASATAAAAGPQIAADPEAEDEEAGRNRSRLGGILLVAIGAVFLWQALALPMGTLHRMGPGLFPAFVAAVIIALGAALVLAAPPIPGGLLALASRPLVMISGAVLAFALLIERAGLIPAAFAAVLLSALSEDRTSLAEPLLLAAGAALAGWLLFTLALGLPLPAFGA